MLFNPNPNPNTYDPTHLDAESRRLLRATIEWFEARGKQQLIADDLSGVWSTEFLDFVKREKLLDKTPLHRFGDPETDIGRVAVFLASDDASYMTGQTLMVDGGSIMLR